MPPNCLTFSVRVGGDEDLAGALCDPLEFGEDVFLALDGDVIGGEAALDVDTEFLGRQVADVPDRCLDREAFTEVLADRFCLGWRLDDNQRGATGQCGSSGAATPTRERLRALVLLAFLAADLAAAFLATVFAGDFATVLAADLRAGDGAATRPRAVAVDFFTVFFAAFLATFLTAFFAAGLDRLVPAAVVPFLIGISSVYLGPLTVHRPIINPHILRDAADVCEADTAVDMDQRALHQLLKIVEIYRSGATQLNQVAPGFGGKPSALVRPLNAERSVARHQSTTRSARRCNIAVKK
jgi:hypothetical protein